MDLNREYQLIEPIPGAGPKSFRARRTSTGQEVSLHLLAGGKTPENEALMTRLRRLPPLSQAKLVQIGEDQGSNVVVTAAPPYLHLNEWLAAEERIGQPEPGEFTRLFQSPPKAPINEPAPPAKPSAAPGEFTRMFQTSTAKPVEQQPAAPPAAPPAREPGEFTRLFQSPAPPAKEPERPQPAPSQPGEFTRFFRGAPPEPTPAAPFPPAAPFAASTSPPPAPVPEPPPADKGGEFTRIFGRPGAEPKAPPLAEVPPAVSAPVPPPRPTPPSPGPSEYTQMIGRPRAAEIPTAAPPISTPQPPAPQIPVPAKPKPATPAAPQVNIILMAIVGIVCFIAGGLVVFFFMKH